MMKKLALAAALSATIAGVAAAGGDTIGTPGDKNCVGQTTAYLAQLAKNADIKEFHGIGGVVIAFNVSVQELKAEIQAYCNQ